ncbi:hypothetical protein ABOONEI_2827 [Aciduliprofundum boonei T469]|nr:hypothetical protein ABOONEI_2827 [Aciduliprofundum boonei T469]
MYEGNVKYEERMVFWLVLLILPPLAFIFLYIFLYQALIGPLGSKPAPQWFILTLTILFFILSYLFGSYKFVITDSSLIAGYPAYRIHLPWKSVVSVEEEKGSMWKYGGYGIRIGKIKGEKVLVLSLPRTKYIRLKLKNSKWIYAIISTKDIESALNYIRQEIEIYRKD